MKKDLKYDQNKCSLCSLYDYKQLKDFCIDNFDLSNNKLKKFFNTKQLNQKINRKDEMNLSLNIVNDLMVNPIYIGPEIEILYEDNIIVVFNKPFNIHSHPLSYLENNNILSFLRSKNYELNINERSYDRGLINRLDYGTSGVMVYLRSEKIWKNLRMNFNEKIKEKLYLAIVKGKITVGQELENYLSSKEKRGKKMVVSDDGQFAKLKFEVVDYNNKNDLSLLKIKIFTGVRHQIRSQLSNIGHPILGDDLYGGDHGARMFLHAYKYVLEVEGKLLEFKSLDAKLFDNFFNLNGLF